MFGVLAPEGDVDEQRCQELVELSRPHPVTFHRAFDVVRDPSKVLETLISLGFSRVLTSWQGSTALEGLPLIKNLMQRAGGRITVVPGGGITERNLERILTPEGDVDEQRCRELVELSRPHPVTFHRAFDVV